MKRSISLCLLFAAALLAAKETIIESNLLEYDGEHIYLDEKVRLEHEVGTILAEHAKLKKDMQTGEFTYLEVKEKGSFLPSFGGKVEFDTLLFFAKEESAELFDPNLVIYHGMLHNYPFTLSSSKLLLDFSQKKIKQIRAMPPVVLLSKNQSSLEADHAIYLASEQKITLFAKSEEERCKLSYDNKLSASSPQMTLLLPSREVHLTEPEGQLSFVKGEPILFTAKEATLFEKNMTLLLEKEIKILQGSYTCTSSHEARLTLLPSIEFLGATTLTNETSCLSCNGKVLVDKQANKIILQAEKEPIFVQSPEGKIFADKISLFFEQTTLIKAIFQGHVACINETSLFVQDKEETVRRFALADLVIYTPLKKELLLKGTKLSKVLFYDAIKKHRFSADEIVIDLPQGESKERIRTFGNVRMSFNDKEDLEMKRYFTLKEGACE
jgi:hypothetical protein